MATAPAHVAVNPPTELPGELYRISLDVYRGMVDHGLLGPKDRVELFDGLLVKKPSRSPQHCSVTYRTINGLEARLPAGCIVFKEDPIELPGGPWGDSCPEPDVAVVEGKIRDYRTHHPGANEVALVVEVASDSRRLAEDRAGLPRYAWANVPNVWIVDLANRRVEVYTEPSGVAQDPRYGRCEIKAPGDVAAANIGGNIIGIPVVEIVR